MIADVKDQDASGMKTDKLEESLEPEGSPPKLEHECTPDPNGYARKHLKDATAIGPLHVVQMGVAYFTELTRETKETWDSLPSSANFDRVLLRGTAANSNSGEARQEVAEKSAVQVKSDPEWSLATRLARAVIKIVEPLTAETEKYIEKRKARQQAAPEEKRIPSGRWRDLLAFKHFPTLVMIPAYVGSIFLLLRSEVVTAMVYVRVTYPEFVLTSFDGQPWITPSNIAFSMTCGFVLGMFWLLDVIPHTKDAIRESRFYKHFGLFATVLFIVGPLLFAHIVGVEKEFGDVSLEEGAEAKKPWTLGLPGYIGTAMFLAVCGSFAAGFRLKAAVDSLFTWNVIEVPERERAATKIATARKALMSNQSVLEQAYVVLETAAAAEKNLELDMGAVLRSEQSDLAARKSQAYIIPSRN